MNKFSACVFDIETTSLEAIGAGWMLCAVVLDLQTRKNYILRYDNLECQLGHEGRLVKALLYGLSRYQVLIGHNINRFDWPYIKSRAIRNSIEISPYRFGVSYDTLPAFRRCGFKTVPNMIGKPTCRLDHIIDFFGIEQEKTPLYPREHWVSVWGDGENDNARKLAMDNLVDHCVKDVRMNEQIFWRLWESDPYRTFVQLK
jgi:uncharacterized protein YprB with RNaseH-like and TPR domain